MAEAFVHTLRRDYVGGADLSSVAAMLDWIRARLRKMVVWRRSQQYRAYVSHIWWFVRPERSTKWGSWQNGLRRTSAAHRFAGSPPLEFTTAMQAGTTSQTATGGIWLGAARRLTPLTSGVRLPCSNRVDCQLHEPTRVQAIAGATHS